MKKKREGTETETEVAEECREVNEKKRRQIKEKNWHLS
jgi:hypothetical protein